MTERWNTWVRMWDLREHPRSMAMIRIVLGIVALWDLFRVAQIGLVPELMGVEGGGGFSLTLLGQNPALWYRVLPATEGSAWLLWFGLFSSALMFTVGVAARPAMFLFVLLSAQWEWVLPGASRAIETVIRLVLLILACSGSDRWGSLWAWWKTGSFWGDGGDVPAWPRHLIVLQLIVMYFMAGVQKFGLAWSPAQEFSALYLIIQDPAIANARYDWVANAPFYQVTQLSTAVTMVWEWSTPVLIWVYWCRFTPDGGGRMRAFTLRWKLHWWWAAIGVVFHVGILALLELGIFPTAMLSLYFCFFHPTELLAGWNRLRRRLGVDP